MPDSGNATAGSPWPVFLAELDWWIACEGDSLVPQTASSRVVAAVPFPLGQRVKNYRIRYRRGLLEESQIRELEARFGWSWNGYSGRSAKIWNQRVAAVRAHVAEHGTLDGLETADPVLSRWLREQRRMSLTAWQRRELGQISGALEPRKGRLEEFLTAMRSWMAAEPDRDAGDVRFSTQHLTAGPDVVPLGRRVAYWRSRYAAGQLEPADVHAIESLPGWRWAPPTRRTPAESRA